MAMAVLLAAMALVAVLAAAPRGGGGGGGGGVRAQDQKEICERLLTCKECRKLETYGCVWCGERQVLSREGNCTYKASVNDGNSFHCEKQTVAFQGVLPNTYSYDVGCFERVVPVAPAPCTPTTCPVGFRCESFPSGSGYKCTVDPAYEPCSPDPCRNDEVCIETHAAGFQCIPISPCDPSGQGNPCPYEGGDRFASVCVAQDNGFRCERPEVCTVPDICPAGSTCVEAYEKDPPYYCFTGDVCAEAQPCPDGWLCSVETSAGSSTPTATCTDPLARHKAVALCPSYDCNNCTRTPACTWCNADGNPLGHYCAPTWSGCPDGTTYRDDLRCPATADMNIAHMCEALECDQCRAYPAHCQWCNSGGDAQCQPKATSRCPGGTRDDTQQCTFACPGLECAPGGEGGVCAGAGMCRCTYGYVFKVDVGCVPGPPVVAIVAGLFGTIAALVCCVALCAALVWTFRWRRRKVKESEARDKAAAGGDGADPNAYGMDPYAAGATDAYGNALTYGDANAGGAYGGGGQYDSSGAAGGGTVDASGGQYDAAGNYYAADGTMYGADGSTLAASSQYGGYEQSYGGGGTYAGGTYAGGGNAYDSSAGTAYLGR